jgi:RHS repeat-associated protein
MTIRSTTPYTYNGDGVLVDDSTTRYTQDLAAPLTQILQTTQISTTNYLYGLDRLAAVEGSSRTWYVGDALGSVRLTLDDAGTPLSLVNYDPWGTPESGTVPTFGFTGELQDAATGLVNLRARWYATGQARFVSRDPFEGFPEQPYSLHSYAYAYSNPVLYSDPSGRAVAAELNGDCQWQFAACEEQTNQLKLYKIQIEASQKCAWNLVELQMVNVALNDWLRAARWSAKNLQNAISPSWRAPVKLIRENVGGRPLQGRTDLNTGDVYLRPYTFRNKIDALKQTIVHELSHTWSFAWWKRNVVDGMDILEAFVPATGGSWQGEEKVLWGLDNCEYKNLRCTTQPIPTYHPHGNPASGYGSLDGSVDPGEDWAEAVTATVYPDHPDYKAPTIVTQQFAGRAGVIRTVQHLPTMDTARRAYVQKLFEFFGR